MLPFEEKNMLLNALYPKAELRSIVSLKKEYTYSWPNRFFTDARTWMMLPEEASSMFWHN